MNEVPLFIVDPADGARKYVGSKQVHDDGTFIWFRRLTNEHVMRSGSFGVDAMTYETHFAGHPGALRVEYGDTVYVAPFEVFERLRREKDHGHGRQYFLAFAYWQVEAKEQPKKPGKPLVFGETVLCSHCKRKRRPDPDCLECRGRGYVQ